MCFWYRKINLKNDFPQIWLKYRRRDIVKIHQKKQLTCLFKEDNDTNVIPWLTVGFSSSSSDSFEKKRKISLWKYYSKKNMSKFQNYLIISTTFGFRIFRIIIRFRSWWSWWFGRWWSWRCRILFVFTTLKLKYSKYITK